MGPIPGNPANVPAIAAEKGQTMGKRLKAAIGRWRERRRERRIDVLERKDAARVALRDYKRLTGDETGPPGGAG